MFYKRVVPNTTRRIYVLREGGMEIGEGCGIQMAAYDKWEMCVNTKSGNVLIVVKKEHHQRKDVIAVRRASNP